MQPLKQPQAEGADGRTILLGAIFLAILGYAGIRLLIPAVGELLRAVRDLNAAYQSLGRGWYRPWTIAGVTVPLLFYTVVCAALLAPVRFRRLAIGALGVVFAIWALLFIYRSSFITVDGQRTFSLFDDAMISMRYAWNAAHGDGLVFNPGERVEGYTNLLMTLIMTLAITLLGKEPSILAMQLFGLACLLAGGWLTVRIGRVVGSRLPGRQHHLAVVLSLGLLFTYYPLVYWALMGMETGLLTVLLLWATFSALRYERSRRERSRSEEAPDRRYLWSTAVALGLAYLTRPDSALIALWILLYLFWRHHASPHQEKGWRAPLLALAIYGCFIGGMSLFRWFYYGQLLPNTYVLKMTGMPLGVRLANGWGFVQPYLQTHGWLYLIAGLALLIPGRRRHRLFLFAIPLLLTGYAAWVGGDPWPYWRFMAPGAPFLFILAAELGVHLWARAGTLARTPWKSPAAHPLGLIQRAPAAVLWPLLLVIGLAVNGVFLPQAWLQDVPYGVNGNHLNVNRSLALRYLTTPEATVGVFGAGVLPYFSERPAIDFFGKADPRVARLPPDLSGAVSWAGMLSVPGHNKVDLTYSIQERRPTYIEAPLSGSQDLTEWANDHYVEVIYRGVSVLLLKDSPAVRWDRVR